MARLSASVLRSALPLAVRSALPYGVLLRRPSARCTLGFAVLALALAAAPASAQTTRTWIGGAGEWSDPVRWSPAGIPGPLDTAVITDVGAVVTLTADVTVAGLTLTRAVDGPFALTVTGTMTWTAGTVSTATLAIPTGADVAFTSGNVTFDGGTLDLDGTLTHASSGDLTLGAGSTLDVGGLYDVTSTSHFSQLLGDGAVALTGTFRKSGSASRFEVRTDVAHGGAVEVQQGSFEFIGGTPTLSGAGAFTGAGVGAGTRLVLDVQTALTAAASLTAFDEVRWGEPAVFAGTLEAATVEAFAFGTSAAHAAVDLTGATISALTRAEAAGTYSDLRLPASVAATLDELAVTGFGSAVEFAPGAAGFTLSDATVTGGGTPRADFGGADLTVDLLTLSGLVEGVDDVTLATGGTFAWQSGTLRVGGTLSSPAGTTVALTGSLHRFGGAWVNGGTVTLEAGSLQLDDNAGLAGTLANHGLFDVTTSSQFVGLIGDGALTNAAAGTYRKSGAAVHHEVEVDVVNDGAFEVQQGALRLLNSAGTLTGAGTFTGAAGTALWLDVGIALDPAASVSGVDLLRVGEGGAFAGAILGVPTLLLAADGTGATPDSLNLAAATITGLTRVEMTGAYGRLVLPNAVAGALTEVSVTPFDGRLLFTPGATPFELSTLVASGASVRVDFGGQDAAVADSVGLAGVLEGLGDLRLLPGAAMTWTSGTVAVADTFATPAGTTVALPGTTHRFAGTWANGTALTLSAGTLQFDDGAGTAGDLLNAGLLDVAYAEQFSALTGTGTLTNAAGGTLRKSGAGASTEVHVTLVNDGAVEVQQGQLRLVTASRTVSGAGPYTGAAGTALWVDRVLAFDPATVIGGFDEVRFGEGGAFGGAITAGTFEFYPINDTLDLTAADLAVATLEVTGFGGHLALDAADGPYALDALLITGAGGAAVDFGGADVSADSVVANGDVDAAGDLTLNDGGGMTWSGGVTVAGTFTVGAGADVAISGASSLAGPLVNGGAISHTNGTFTLERGGVPGVVTNAGTYTFAVPSQFIAINGSGSFANTAAGVFVRDGAAPFSEVRVPFTNGGTVDVNGGDLRFTSAFANEAAGRVEGGGAVAFGALTNDGTFAPGAAGAPAALTATPYAMSAAAALELDLNGAANDRLVSGAAVALDGALAVALGVEPQPGETYTLVEVTSGALTGAFADVTVTGTTRDWAVGYTGTTATLTFFAMPGELVIAEFLAAPDPADGAPAAGRWVEVFNPTAVAIPLAGYALADDGTDSHALGALTVPAGGFAVLCAEDDPALNGDFACDYEWAGFDLDDRATGDEIVLANPVGTEVDRVAYAPGAAFPVGAAQVFTGVTTDDNGAYPAAWADATTREPTYAPGGVSLGSPGTAGALQNLGPYCYTLASGTWDAADAALWSCGHVPTPADVVAVASGDAVTFDAGGGATVAVLRVENGATLTVADALDVDGPVDVNGTLALDGPAGGALAVGGDFTNGGALDLGTGRVTFDGAADQTLADATGVAAIPYLTVDKPGGSLVLAAALHVGGDLALAQGTVDNAAQPVRLTSTAARTGTLTHGAGGFADPVIHAERHFAAPTAGWRMIASPLDDTYAALNDDFLTQGGAWATNAGGEPVLFGWDGAAQAYAAVTGPAAALGAGAGYFFYAFDADHAPLPATWDVTGPEHGPTARPVAFNTTPDDSFDLLGNPFAGTLDWHALLDNAGTSGVGETFWVWDPAAVAYRFYSRPTGLGTAGRYVAPAQGLWVQGTAAAASLAFAYDDEDNAVDPVQVGFAGTTPHVALAVRGADAQTAALRSPEAYLAYLADATPGRDPADVPLLLPPAADYVLLWSALPAGDALALDARAPEVTAEAYALHVAATVPGAYRLTWPALHALPPAWTLTLTDAETGATVDLRADTAYTFTVGAPTDAPTARARSGLEAPRPVALAASGLTGGAARFVLHVAAVTTAGEAAAPAQFALEAVAPNPARGAAAVRYAVPAAARVVVEVYDVLGRRVATLADAEHAAGRHAVRLDAAALASGVYVVRMEADGFAATRRVTVVR